MARPIRPGARGKVLVALVAALGLLLILGRLFVSLYVEILWHAEAGYLSVFWRRSLWSLGTRFLAGVAVGLVVFLNLRLVARTLGGIQIKRRFGNLEISEQLPRSYVLWAIVALSALLGLWFGGSVSESEGIRLLLALNGSAWGVAEPILGRDVAFYVFLLPLLSVGVTLGLITIFLVFTVSVGGYAATGALRWGKDGVVVGEQPRRHLGAVVAGFVLLLALQFLLGRYTLLQFGSSGVQEIFGYTDAEARLPGLTVLAALAFLAAVLILWGSWKNRLAPVLSGLGAVLVGGLVVGQFWPSLVQRFRVEPNELERETPYIEHNIAFTRLGFDLADMERARFAYAPPGRGIDWERARDQLAGLPVWTDNTLLATFRELEARFRYYEFSHVDIDRYRRPDRTDASAGPDRQPVAISVREIDPGGIEDPNWQNRHIRERYIAGMGAVAAAAAERTLEGRPPMYLSGIPPEFSGGDAPLELRLTRPFVYVGATPQRYAIINPTESAFLDSIGRPGEPGEDYPEGILLSSFFRTAAFAWRFRDANLLFAREVTDSSRFAFRRQVVERVEAVAPFFLYPEPPYPVVHEGRVVWILEGFTATRRFPLSSPSELRGRRGPANYLRNNVKVTVDALTGEMRFYALPGRDPLLEAYARAFPGLLRPLEEMPPELREHLRYAPSLLDLQAQVLLQYHQNTAPQFHGQQDVWARPSELSRSTSAVEYEAEYGIYRLPGDGEERFWLTTVFVPAGRQNLTAILAGTLEPDGARELRLFDVPVEDQVPGPRQVEALIEQDPEISQQFSLWRTGGSQVWTGHLHLVPVDSTILYMEPVFLAAEADAIPQLRGFVVSDGNRVTMEPTLVGALSAMSGGAVPLPPERRSGAEEPGAAGPDVPPGTGVWSAAALELLDRAESRLREGDYRGFGEALAELRRLLVELGEGGGAGSRGPGGAPGEGGR